MRKTVTNTKSMATETIPDGFTPSQEQIAALAHRLMPEIKKFFADEQIQKEFAEWKERTMR